MANRTQYNLYGLYVTEWDICVLFPTMKPMDAKDKPAPKAEKKLLTSLSLMTTFLQVQSCINTKDNKNPGTMMASGFCIAFFLLQKASWYTNPVSG